MLSFPIIGAGAALALAAGVGGYLLRDLWPTQKSAPASAPKSAAAGGAVGAEPDNRWTERAAPFVVQLHRLRPDLAYLWGPRLSDFLAVSTKHRGTQKGAETSVRLRNYRVGLVLMDPRLTQPIAAILVAGVDNSVATSLFEKIGLPFVEADPSDKRAVEKALGRFSLLPSEAPAKKTSAVPASTKEAAPAKPARTSPAKKQTPSTPNATAKDEVSPKPATTQAKKLDEGSSQPKKGAAQSSPPSTSSKPKSDPASTPPSVSATLPPGLL